MVYNTQNYWGFGLYPLSIRFRLGSHGLTPQIELGVGSASIAPPPLLIPCIGVHWIVS
jgi:hypothetical protein